MNLYIIFVASAATILRTAYTQSCTPVMYMYTIARRLRMLTAFCRSYINRPEKIGEFMNPLYEPNSNVIWPSVAPQSLVSDVTHSSVVDMSVFA